MDTINSVLGPMDTANLGFTLPHEHLINSSAGVNATYGELVDRPGALETAVKDLTQATSKASTPSSRYPRWIWGGTCR